MSGIEILKAFDFQIKDEPVSIYPFSPVYRMNDFIVKPTQRPLERAKKLVSYTTSLKDNRIHIVTPVNIHTDNPQTIGDEVYVVYPFIKGATYSGKEHEIYEAGKLLGHIHHLSPDKNEFELEEYDVFDFNKEEIEENVRNIEKYARSVDYKIDSSVLKEKLLQIVAQQVSLKNSRLPSVATPHDYKANNLIYTPEPFLIDPDNAIWIPKIFDLALVLLLFHNELKTAPDAIFSPQQWQVFLSGYKEYGSFTELEHRQWQKAVDHVFMDEVMWLMSEVEEDWSNPSQLQLFDSLLNMLFHPSEYHLN